MSSKNRVVSLLASVLLGSLIFGIVYNERLDRLDIPFNYAVKDFGGLSIWPVVDGQTPTDESFDHIDLPLALLGAKLTVESSYYEGTERLNYPFGFTPIDFPVVGNRGNALLLQIISSIFREPGEIVNVFSIASFACVLLAAWWVLSRLTQSRALVVLGTLVITFLPMHFATEQNFTANYSTMVLGSGLVYRLAIRQKLSRREVLVVALALSLFGFYWNLFTLVLLASSVFIAWILRSREEMLRLFSAGVTILISNVVMFSVDLFPSVLFWRSNGVVKGIARLPGFVDSWPFRTLDGLVAPAWSSVVPYFLRRDFFVRGTQQIGEGIYSYGPYGAVAIAIAVFSLRSIAQGQDKTSVVAKSGQQIAHLLLVTTPLWVGVSGVAHLPGVFGLTTVKSWERFQIPAAILSVFIVTLFVDSMREQAFKRLKKFLISSALVLGLLAAVPWTHFGKTDISIKRWDAHTNFFRGVESRIGMGPVFWLPVELYPEGGYLGRTPPYHSLYGYIFTDNTRWNTAATRERYLRWQYDLLSLPSPLFVNRLNDFGFRGVVIDRLSQGIGLPPGILSLVERLKSKNVLYSQDKRFIFVEIDEFFRTKVVKQTVVNGVIMSDTEYPF